MKLLKILPCFLLLSLASCSSVSVATDYEKTARFDSYTTYAYSKAGIDQAEISDIDKKRILRAIDRELAEKGLTKSDNPDLIISIFTKERQRVDVWSNWWGPGWGWWGPGWGWGWWGTPAVNMYPEGSLFIDILDAKKNELVWQGEGFGYLTNNPKKKEKRINEFVKKILSRYPPK